MWHSTRIIIVIQRLIKTLIKGKASFEYCRGGDLWYSTESGFIFPVPISDIGTATFLKEDKGILFMRYIITITIPIDGHRLASYGSSSVMGYKEGAEGGKIVLTGSNFMIDNYGLLGLYDGADNNALLALRIVLWCASMLV